ncbi:MAG TPA: class II fructose-bisphosphate aldolase [Solirubrobacteraceae bacterium]|nr:class II fructose-bisphosphate aldolase [Solirubrobacteraceae bacterium]
MLTPLVQLLSDARSNGYAVGYFEAFDLYSLEAIIDAAEEAGAPVITGVGGLSCDPAWLGARGMPAFGASGAALAARAAVPVSLLFNEAPDLGQAIRALGAGYNAVMLVAGGRDDDGAEQVRALCQIAHDAQVAVEGEIGRLAEMRDGTVDEREARLTSVARAREFVAATGVDCLGVSVGNVHFVTGGYRPRIDFERIAELASAVDVPLALHGGSGLSDDQLRRAVAAGIAKVNFATRLKQVFGQELRAALAQRDGDPNALFGSHLDGDVLAAAARALKAQVAGLIDVLGGSGRAR